MSSLFTLGLLCIVQWSCIMSNILFLFFTTQQHPTPQVLDSTVLDSCNNLRTPKNKRAIEKKI